MLDRDTVLHVAQLARLRLDDAEIEAMASELSSVLDHVQRIRELDLEDVPATFHVIALSSFSRPDEPQPCLTQEQALSAAPERVDEAFGVPSPGRDEP